jgi:hypothetical protein
MGHAQLMWGASCTAIFKPGLGRKSGFKFCKIFSEILKSSSLHVLAKAVKEYDYHQ